MKKLFSIVCLLALGIVASFATDKLVATYSGLGLKPLATYNYETDYITISLEGESIYASMNFDVYLPEGYEFALYNNNPDIMLCKDGLFTVDSRGGQILNCSFDSGIQSDGALRIALWCSTGTELQATSGKLLTIGVKATTAASSINEGISIKNVKLTKKDVSATTPADAQYINTITVANNSEITTTVTVLAAAKWGTRMFPFNMTAVPEGIKLYSVQSISKDVITLQEQSAIEAWKPYIIYADEDKTIEYTGSTVARPEGNTVTNGYLVGAMAPQTITSGYVLQKQEGDTECVFYKVAASAPINVPAGKCYLIQASEAKSLIFTIGEATAIKTVAAEAEGSEAVYDLQGRRTSNSQRGIYIKNGKKVAK